MGKDGSKIARHDYIWADYDFEEEMTSTLKKNPLSFLLGLAVFAGLLYWIRATTVMEHLARVGPWIMVLILAYGLVQLRAKPSPCP